MGYECKLIGTKEWKIREKYKYTIWVIVNHIETHHIIFLNWSNNKSASAKINELRCFNETVFEILVNKSKTFYSFFICTSYRMRGGPSLVHIVLIAGLKKYFVYECMRGNSMRSLPLHEKTNGCCWISI